MEEKCEIVINKEENIFSFKDVPEFRLFVYYGKLYIKGGDDWAICVDSSCMSSFSGKENEYVMVVKKVEITV